MKQSPSARVGGFKVPRRGSEATRRTGDTDHTATLPPNAGSCPTGHLENQSRTQTTQSTTARSVHAADKQKREKIEEKKDNSRGRANLMSGRFQRT